MPKPLMASLYAAEALLSRTWPLGLMRHARFQVSARSRANIISPSVLFLVGSTQMELLLTWYNIIWYLLPQLERCGNLPV